MPIDDAVGKRSSGRMRLQLVQVLTGHQLMIQGYAYAVLRDHQLAEDVFQEVAAVVAQQGDRVPGGEATVPWLRAVTRRKALQLRRQHRRRELLLGEDVLELLEGTPDDGDDDAIGELRAAMASCVDQLPGDGRAVVEGRYAAGRSCEDLAEEIGRSVQGVYGLLKRLRLSLARCVEQRLGRRMEAG